MDKLADKWRHLSPYNSIASHADFQFFEADSHASCNLIDGFLSEFLKMMIIVLKISWKPEMVNNWGWSRKSFCLFVFWMSTTVLALKLRNPSYCRVLSFERQNVFLVWWLDLAWWWATVLGEGVPAPVHGPQFLLRESSSVGSAQAAVPSENPTCSGVVFHGLLLLHCGLLQKFRSFQGNFPSFSKFGIHRSVSQTDFAVKLAGSSLVQHERVRRDYGLFSHTPWRSLLPNPCLVTYLSLRVS